MAEPEVIPADVTLIGAMEVPGIASNTAYMWEPTTEALAVPAVDGTIAVTVVNAIEYAIGGYIFFPFIGWFRITARNTDAQTITILNTGTPGNEDAATAIAAGTPMIHTAAPSIDTGIIDGEIVWDPGSILAGNMEAQEVAVVGAIRGDFVLASFSLDVSDLILNAQVTANDVVTAILFNPLVVLRGSAVWDPASLAVGAADTTTITVTGAVLGDIVQVSFSLDLQELVLTGYVSAADTVEVVLENINAANPVDLASGTVSAMVMQANPIDLGSGTLYTRVYKRISV